MSEVSYSHWRVHPDDSGRIIRYVYFGDKCVGYIERLL